MLEVLRSFTGLQNNPKIAYSRNSRKIWKENTAKRGKKNRIIALMALSIYTSVMEDFEFERRFYCHEMPAELDDGDAPALIIQSYYVHDDNYALRVRMKSRKINIPMTLETDPLAILDTYRDNFDQSFITVKGPVVGGTRYEAEREIDVNIAAELIKRGGIVSIKNRYSVWLNEDGWNIDVFGGKNAPLVIAEAERSGPVTNLTIPSFCVTEVTDQPRFSNDGLANRPFSLWVDEFERELAEHGPHFQQVFGTNKME